MDINLTNGVICIAKYCKLNCNFIIQIYILKKFTSSGFQISITWLSEPIFSSALVCCEIYINHKVSLTLVLTMTTADKIIIELLIKEIFGRSFFKIANLKVTFGILHDSNQYFPLEEHADYSVFKYKLSSLTFTSIPRSCLFLLHS